MRTPSNNGSSDPHTSAALKLAHCSAVFAESTHVPNPETDTQATERATSVAISHICTMHAMRLNSNN